MAQGQAAQRFVEWVEALPGDVDMAFALLTNEGVAVPGRRLIAGALSYLLTQLDLIPDHEPAGAIDDALVLRVACALASEHAAKLGAQESAQLGRLANEEEHIREFLGGELFAKLKRYVIALAERPVRSRTADQLLSDARARSDLRRELDAALKKAKAPPADDAKQAAALETTVTAYLKMKLK
jgi:uncharacterized membrane protein YkvA (DUF1232 family)